MATRAWRGSLAAVALSRSSSRRAAAERGGWGRPGRGGCGRSDGRGARTPRPRGDGAREMMPPPRGDSTMTVSGVLNVSSNCKRQRQRWAEPADNFFRQDAPLTCACVSGWNPVSVSRNRPIDLARRPPERLVTPTVAEAAKMRSAGDNIAASAPSAAWKCAARSRGRGDVTPFVRHASEPARMERGRVASVAAVGCETRGDSMLGGLGRGEGTCDPSAGMCACGNARKRVSRRKCSQAEMIERRAPTCTAASMARVAVGPSS